MQPIGSNLRTPTATARHTGARGNGMRGFDGRGGAVRLVLPRVLGGGWGVSPGGLCCRGCWGAWGAGWVGWYGLIEPPRPPPPVILPGAAVAALRLAGAFAPGFAVPARAAAGGWGGGGRVSPGGLSCRGCWGAGLGWVGWYGLITPPRPPPPVILPGAAFASLCLAGAFGAGLRPSGSRCRLPVGKVLASCLRMEGRGKNPSWGGVDVTSDNRQDSNHPRLARVPRLGLRGPGPQVLPTTSASRAVRWNPVSGFFRAPVRPRAVLRSYRLQLCVCSGSGHL